MTYSSPESSLLEFPSSDSSNLFIESRKGKLDRDHRARQYFWTVSKGKPTTSSHMRSTTSPIPRHYSHNRSASTSQPQAYPKHIILEKIPLTPLSGTLQTYFYKMQRMVSLTCHPCEINSEATQIADVLLRSSDGPVAISNVARIIFCAGIAKIEYSRTVALLVHDVMMDLMWKSWDIKMHLEGDLLSLASSAFLSSWKNSDLTCFGAGDGLASVGDTLDGTRTQILNITAFIGDLFAIGIVPLKTMYHFISMLLEDLSTVTHCRALYLLLLRASLHVTDPLDQYFMLTCRKKITERASRESESADELMMRRWMIEICNVIDRTLAQDAAEPDLGGIIYAPVVFHRWDRKLSCEEPILLTLLRGTPTDCSILAAEVE